MVNKYFSIAPITFHRGEKRLENPCSSVLVVSWNNLDFLKLCVESIEKNSTYRHQILIHVNEGTDGTLEWVQERGYSYTHSKENVGICFGMNALSSFIDTEYVVLIDDDNYVVPGWDKYLLDEIKKIGHSYFVLSSTRIEPLATTDKSAITPGDFGLTPQTFREAEFLERVGSYSCEDWSGSNWYPMILHRDIWFLVGGLSNEFSPGMASDPDFMMKLWQAGVRYFKGVSASRAYHFGARTTSRVKKNNGKKQFTLKWGMNKSTLFKYYLKMSEPFRGELDEHEAFRKAKRKIAYDRFRMRFFS
jgi:GT2 family glycosyltransferase